MTCSNRRIGLLRMVLGGVAIGLFGFVLVLLLVPRYRWRVEIVVSKALGGLPEITWKDLIRLNRHGDPFNLKELLITPSPYVAIKNPFESAEDVSAGERLFQTNCALCHGANGVGGAGGPVLKQRQMRNGSSDWAIFKTI